MALNEIISKTTLYTFVVVHLQNSHFPLKTSVASSKRIQTIQSFCIANYRGFVFSNYQIYCMISEPKADGLEIFNRLRKARIRSKLIFFFGARIGSPEYVINVFFFFL